MTKHSSDYPLEIEELILHKLDSGSPKDIQAAKKYTAELLEYHWHLYADLARQRALIQEQLQQTLIQASTPYEISNWQRAVKYKYGLHPLSTVGSLNYIGGRFNTGKSVNPEVPHFPGLYIAKNKDTALQEHLGQQHAHQQSQLTPRELALTNPASETIVSVSGKFDKVFDLTKPSRLEPFIELTKHFTLSKSVAALTKKLNLDNPSLLINSTSMLLDTLLHPEWRVSPSNYDVPATSQIFGHLIFSAGIEGILYPSKFTNQSCLVIYPQNFIGTESFLQLDDEPPHPKVPIRIDETNWRLSELDAKEII